LLGKGRLMKRGEYSGVGIVVLIWVGAVAGDVHYIGDGQSIQAAIDAADNGDEIEVAPGTYTGPGDETENSALIDFKGKAVRLYSRDGPAGTTIDGSRYQHVVRCISGEGRGAVLEGFTITHGGSGEYPSGGGMYNANSSPTVTHCVFASNHAYYFGGGMYNVNAGPLVTDCTFTDNATYVSGSALYNYGGRPVVTNCIFTANLGGEHGGATYNDQSNLTLTNCLFSGNRSAFEGSAMYNHNCSPIVTNCTIVNNDIGAAEGGYGGAIYNEDSNPTLTNCILWGNARGQITGNPGTVSYSDVQGGWAGAGNINADPRFVSAGDYHLAPGSPCIDAGTNSPPGGLPATDIESNPRVLDGNGDGSAVADMGAYEAPAADAGQLLRNLLQRVRDLNLAAGITTSLEAKLNTALGKIVDRNAQNDAAAVNALEAFIQEVQAQRGKKIAAPDADALVAAAQQIIDLRRGS
jgi:hypothetical protein